MNKFTNALLLLGCAVVLVAASKHETDPQAWWKHIEYLASDEMKGRNTGSPEYVKAAQYVAAQYDSAGLKPAGIKGYFQPVSFVQKTIDESKSSLSLVRDGKVEPLKLGTDAYMSTRVDLAPKIEADVVFVGYGLRFPELGIDDFEGLNVKGKLVLVLAGEPAGIPGPLLAHNTAERSKVLRELGAVGSVTLASPKRSDLPWTRAALMRTAPSMALSDPNMNESKGIVMSISVNPDAAEKWFEGTGHTAKELIEADDQHKPLPKFPLKVKVRATSHVDRKPIESMNVVGLLPGSDPKLKNEYVVMSAHLDHIGTGPAIDGDTIYNGAMDNASGVASLIEIARQLKGAKLKRSVVFLSVTGEEKGLLGSKFFANSPTVKGKIVTNLNLDMFLPIVPPKYLVAYGMDESELGDRLKPIAQKLGVEILPDPAPGRNIFIRSDQYNFIKQGVPALSFKISAKKGTPESEVLEQWMKKRYHAPSDDLKQPVSLEAAGVFNDMLLELTRNVANTEERPHWKSESFFKRFEKKTD